MISTQNVVNRNKGQMGNSKNQISGGVIYVK